MRAALRYGRLSTGIGIPCSYALETEDGRSLLFPSDTEWPELARELGLDIPSELDADFDERLAAAIRELDAHEDATWDLDEIPYTFPKEEAK